MKHIKIIILITLCTLFTISLERGLTSASCIDPMCESCPTSTSRCFKCKNNNYYILDGACLDKCAKNICKTCDTSSAEKGNVCTACLVGDISSIGYCYETNLTIVYISIGIASFILLVSFILIIYCYCCPSLNTSSSTNEKDLKTPIGGGVSLSNNNQAQETSTYDSNQDDTMDNYRPHKAKARLSIHNNADYGEQAYMDKFADSLKSQKTVHISGDFPKQNTIQKVYRNSVIVHPDLMQAQVELGKVKTEQSLNDDNSIN